MVVDEGGMSSCGWRREEKGGGVTTMKVDEGGMNYVDRGGKKMMVE